MLISVCFFFPQAYALTSITFYLSLFFSTYMERKRGRELLSRDWMWTSVCVLAYIHVCGYVLKLNNFDSIIYMCLFDRGSTAQDLTIVHTALWLSSRNLHVIYNRHHLQWGMWLIEDVFHVVAIMGYGGMENLTLITWDFAFERIVTSMEIVHAFWWGQPTKNTYISYDQVQIDYYLAICYPFSKLKWFIWSFLV